MSGQVGPLCPLQVVAGGQWWQVAALTQMYFGQADAQGSHTRAGCEAGAARLMDRPSAPEASGALWTRILEAQSSLRCNGESLSVCFKKASFWGH